MKRYRIVFLSIASLHRRERLCVLEEEEEGVCEDGVAAGPVLPLPLAVLDELGAVERALLDHHDAHVAHSDVGRRHLQRRGELALKHLRLAQLSGLVRTCDSQSDDQFLFVVH